MVSPLTFFAELFPFLISGIENMSAINFDTVRDNFTKLGTNKSRPDLIMNFYIFFGFKPLCNFVYG